MSLVWTTISSGDAADPAAVIHTPRPPRLEYDQEDRLTPGLALRFAPVGGEGEAADARAARLAALYVAQSDAASVFLSPGPFLATWEGYLFLDLVGDYTFSLAGHGTASLTLNNQPIFSGRGELGAVAPKTVGLHAGHNKIRVEYTSPPDGDSVIRVLWEGRSQHVGKDRAFVAEAVSPDRLLHDPSGPLLTAQTIRREGRELFATRSCIRCHLVSDALRTEGGMPEIRRDNPALVLAGDRFETKWIYHYLLDPQAVRDDTTMPRTLTHLDPAAAGQAAADIAVYLASLAGSAEMGNGAARASSGQSSFPEGVEEEGEIRFEQIGCIACHRLTPPDEEDFYERTSLHWVAEKSRPGAICQFLRQPHAHYRYSRMPDPSLTQREAADLAAFLRATSESALPEASHLAAASASRGKDAFTQFGCAACHALDDSDPRRESLLALPTTESDNGCLAESPEKRKSAPDFHLTEREQSALSAFLRYGTGSLARQVPAEASIRLADALRCSACHGRDGEESYLSEVVLEEGVQGLPPERVPHLTWAGEKLQGEWLVQLLRGDLRQRSRPWLKARMPAFPAYASPLAAGLPAEHGFSGAIRPRPTPNSSLVQVGASLTTQNVGFYCVECHSTGDKPPASAFDHRGIDFPHITRRLQYDYYLRWLSNPTRIDPLSKMPQFSKQPKPDILDGSAERQFEALWHYLESRSDKAR